MKYLTLLLVFCVLLMFGTVVYTLLILPFATVVADPQTQNQTIDTIPVKVTYYFTSGFTYCEERTVNGLVALSPDLMVKYKCGDSILLEVPNTHFNGYYIVSDKTAKGKVNTVDVYLNIDKGVWRGNIIKK
jgi:hypothetical protein